MDPKAIRDVLVESSDQVYQYVSDMQFVTDPPLGVSVTGVSGCDVGDGFAILRLSGPVPEISGLMLMVDEAVIREGDAGFDRYDEISRTVVVRPGEEVLRRMSEPGCRVRLLSDMRFIISSVGDFYRRYGDLLTLPTEDPVSVAPAFPEGVEPSGSQVAAVHGILTHRLSYIWGAPGTGKTQFVLAACIRACIGAGRRVAVFAPTNNSVEQVLRGIIKALPEGDPILGATIRLGVPTKGFLEEHPGMCEDRQAQRRVASCMRNLDLLEEVMFERSCDELEWEFLELRRMAHSLQEDGRGRVLLSDHPDLKAAFSEMVPMLSSVPLTRDLVSEAEEGDFRTVIDKVCTALYDRERPAAGIEEYTHWSDQNLMAALFETRRELEDLISVDTGARVERASLIASTPHQFISRFRPRRSEDDGRPVLDVDHIFLDEAGYCGLMQAAALFTNGVPVTMLGDHMQLPPVSQLDDALLTSSAKGGGRLGHAFLWNMSALHCEGLMTEGPGALSSIYTESSDPVFHMTFRADLTDSHRFGSNLGRVLDRWVYRNGMTGSSDGGDLRICCIDAVCDSREGRENRAEAMAVADMLRREGPELSEVAVLTPYTAQLALIKRMVGRRYRDSVMTVHGSQGREWDTVVLSVADNGVLSRDVPFRFTSSSTGIGMRVVNTAVSRAKKRLVLVCDREFWIGREDELIGGILREVDPEDVWNFNRRCPDAS